MRGVKSSDNLVAQVEGDIGEVDGVLRITAIRLSYELEAPADSQEKIARALESYADKCPAYQSVKDCIPCSWKLTMS